MRLGGGHGAIVALFVELPHLVLFCKGASDAEGPVEGWLITAVSSSSALHNKTIVYKIISLRWIGNSWFKKYLNEKTD